MWAIRAPACCGPHREVTDDIIGPMVHHEVKVRVRRGRRNVVLFVNVAQVE